MLCARGHAKTEAASGSWPIRRLPSRTLTWPSTAWRTITLKLLSQLFSVSIHTLLGAPQRLICQCCGMPLEDPILSREPDGSFNEEYCTWCYSGGKFTYTSKEQLIDFCVAHMASEDWPAQQVRAHMETVVPELKHWKK